MASKKNASVIVDPAHEYVQKAIKEGRCRKEDLPIKSLTVDLKFQARVSPYEPNHVAQLRSILDMQGWLAPIVVFEEIDPKTKKATRRVVDGFTRTRVYQDSELSKIPAWVISGDDKEALAFAAMANQQNTCRSRKEEDIIRATEILFFDDTWWDRSDLVIGNWVGISSGTATKYRNMYSAKTGKKIPEYTIGKNGCRYRKHKRKNLNTDTTSVYQGSNLYFYGRMTGKRYSGKTEDDARENMRKGIAEKKDRIMRLEYSIIFKLLSYRYGFKSSQNANKYPGIRYLYRIGNPSIIAVTCDFKTKESLPEAVGQLDTAVDILKTEKLYVARGQLVAAQGIVRDPSARKIILCYKEDGPFWLVDLYKQAGFEFMTPEELIAMLESESQSQAGGQSA